MKPVKIRLSQGDLRAQGMYILLEEDEEKYTKNGITSYENYVEYPDNIRDAKEFVEKYKNQSRK